MITGKLSFDFNSKQAEFDLLSAQLTLLSITKFLHLMSEVETFRPHICTVKVMMRNMKFILSTTW